MLMAARIYGTRRWSVEDDTLLRMMCEQGKSLTLITAKLKRPMKSIMARAEDLHINIPGTGIGRKR
jgi:3-deoxy-D-manno-octulosonate 8-phosphate phosphatase KdsC-like HAD superfamily phosphatase